MTFCTRLYGCLRYSFTCNNQFRRCGFLAIKSNSDPSVYSGEENKTPIERTQQDLSHVSPFLSDTFNLAAYINTSETLQKLVQLKVDLSKIEKKPYRVEKFLKLDFENDMKDHIIFLSEFVDIEQIGEFLTKNPLIFCQQLDDLKIRVNYLHSKKFNNVQVSQIIRRNPFWLMFSTIRIDRRLGFFQQYFDLTGQELRDLATTMPKLITYNLHHVKCNTFVIKEEMGFSDAEIKTIIKTKPKVLMLNQKTLLERLNYIHNTMHLSHTTIVKNPGLLLSRNFRIKQRHLFLEKLGRAQYDPKKENYVPVMALVENSDVEFCRNYAKCNIDDFNLFLKTL